MSKRCAGLAFHLLASLVLVALVGSGLATPFVGSAQIASGATLTVLRGQVSVLSANGTPISPAASGLSLGVGDQVATGASSGALITFFEGSEVELGSNTAIVIKDASGQGSRTSITIASVVGSTVHRVVTLTDPGSSYRVEAGGTVGLVRGTVFGHHVDPKGDIVVALQRCDAPPSAPPLLRTACLEFPFAGHHIPVGTKAIYSARGNLLLEPFRLSDSLFNVITEFPQEELGTEIGGQNTGSTVLPEQISLRPRHPDEDVSGPPCVPPTPGRTVLVAAASTGNTVLQVQCQDGFRVGDLLIINPGGSPSEITTLRGFGSFIVDPVLNNYPTGTSVIVGGPPAFSINDSSVTEGDNGTQNLTFTVNLSAILSTTSTVEFRTGGGGTATAGTCGNGNADFVANNGMLTFNPGVTSRTFNIVVCGDTTDENNETIPMGLANATVATIADPEGIGTVIDNDGTPSISINDPSVTEGDAGTTTLGFAVTLSNPSAQQVTVQLATASANGTGIATSGAACGGQIDYIAIGTTTLTFNPGDTTQPGNVTVCNDTADEPNETLVVNLSNATNASIADAQGQGTIIDNDPAPTLAVNDVSILEGDAGSANLGFTVTLTGSSRQTVTIQFATANGTATGGSCGTAGVDYATTTGTLTFNPGTTTLPIDVAGCGDTTDEVDETFVVNLSNATNATIADNQGTGTITDNDPLSTLSINDRSLPEQDSGQSDFIFTVTLNQASAKTITVNFGTQDSSATGGIDYESTNGTLTFNPGDLTRMITVKVNGDGDCDAGGSDEEFFVNLSSPTNATVADGSGVGTIQEETGDCFGGE